MIKKTSLFKTVLVLLVVLIPAAVSAQLFFFGADAAVSYRDYVQGIGLTEGMVAKPTLWLGVWNFGLSSAADIVLADAEVTGLTEISTSLYYVHSGWRFSVYPGFNLYVFPSRTDYEDDELPLTGELYCGIAYRIADVGYYRPAIFTAYTEHSVDLISAPGAYWGLLRMHYYQEILPPSLALGAYVGSEWATGAYNNHYFNVEGFSFNLVSAQVSLDWTPWWFVYIESAVDFTYIIDSDLRSQIDDAALVSPSLTVGAYF